MNRKRWPNILSALRIALMPVVLMTAISGSRVWFIVVLVISLLTDVLDGYLARRLDAFSDLGRKLDSFADYITMLTGLAGIALLWPTIVHRELAWVATGLAAFFGVVVFGLVRLGRAPCYHTWASKLGTFACAVSLIPLLAEWTALPFHIVICVQVLAGLEEMTIALLIPSHVGEMRSLWHAVRLRRENIARLNSARPSAQPSAMRQ